MKSFYGGGGRRSTLTRGKQQPAPQQEEAFSTQDYYRGGAQRKQLANNTAATSYEEEGWSYSDYIKGVRKAPAQQQAPYPQQNTDVGAGYQNYNNQDQSYGTYDNA